MAPPCVLRVQRVMTAAYRYDLDATVTNDNTYFYIVTTTGQIRVGSVDFPNPIPAAVIDNTGRTVPTLMRQTDPTLDYEGVNTFSSHRHCD